MGLDRNTFLFYLDQSPCLLTNVYAFLMPQLLNESPREIKFQEHREWNPREQGVKHVCYFWAMPPIVISCLRFLTSFLSRTFQ